MTSVLTIDIILYSRFTDGIVLLQANSPYERDQWFHSLLWKFNMLNSKKALKLTSCPEIIAKELKVRILIFDWRFVVHHCVCRM